MLIVCDAAAATAALEFGPRAFANGPTNGGFMGLPSLLELLTTSRHRTMMFIIVVVIIIIVVRFKNVNGMAASGRIVVVATFECGTVPIARRVASFVCVIISVVGRICFLGSSCTSRYKPAFDLIQHELE